MKLNLGAGMDYREGWINADNNHSYKADDYFDVEVYPYPFEDNTFEEIELSHLFEHLNNPIRVLEELYRISKPNAIIRIRVPHFSHFSAYGDLTHKRYYSSYIFSQFAYDGNYYTDKAKFKQVKLKFHPIRCQNKLWHRIYTKCFYRLINLSALFTDQFLSKIILVSEMEFELEVIK